MKIDKTNRISNERSVANYHRVQRYVERKSPTSKLCNSVPLRWHYGLRVVPLGSKSSNAINQTVGNDFSEIIHPSINLLKRNGQAPLFCYLILLFSPPSNLTNINKTFFYTFDIFLPRNVCVTDSKVRSVYTTICSR